MINIMSGVFNREGASLGSESDCGIALVRSFGRVVDKKSLTEENSRKNTKRGNVTEYMQPLQGVFQ